MGGYCSGLPAMPFISHCPLPPGCYGHGNEGAGAPPQQQPATAAGQHQAQASPAPPARCDSRDPRRRAQNKNANQQNLTI
jgi:hypothetical protein